MIVVHPNIRCTICGGNVYQEEGEMLCLLCGRTVKNIRREKPSK